MSLIETHPFIVQGQSIDGVMIKALTKHRDDRGYFMEAFQESWDGPMAPVQWSVVKSEPRVLRGPHLHLNHDEYIACIEGEVYVGLRDVRPDSPTRNQSCMVRLTGEDNAAIIFPKGLVHGWCFTKQTIHLQAVSESYMDYHPHDNFGCLWSDPALEMPWPVKDPIVSERAQGFPTLAELEAMLEEIWKI